MKTKIRRISKRTLAIFVGIMMVLSSIGIGELFTVYAANGTVTDVNVYFTPYHDNNEGGGWIKDNKTIGARYLYGDSYWQSATGSDTGRTKGGQRVYKVTVKEKYGGLDHLYFRNNDLENNTTNEQHAVNGWTTLSTFQNKYYNGSSWATYTPDTFKIRNNGSDFATLSYSSGREYSATASLTAGTTYKFNVHDGTNYWANSGAGTITGTDTKTMYRYGSGGSTDCVEMTPTVSGTYTFTWTLNGAGSREDAGDLKITYPTTYTVSYNKGSNGTGDNTTDTKVKDVALTLKGAIFTRTGYTQTAWNTNSAGTGGTSYALSGNYTANAAVTLYPTWTANSYTITYKDQGDSSFSGTHASGYPTSHTYGTATTLKSASKDGYTFGGWYTTSACTGSAVTSLGATAYTSNITLYAKWTLKTYTITLSESGTTGGTLKVDDAAFTSGSTVTYGSHSFRVDAPSGYKITAISGIGTWTNNNTYATLGSTSITANKTISVTYAVLGTCGFELSSSSASINIGATTSFTATPNSYHSSGTISVSSSSTGIATVSKSGNTYTVTGVAPGTANITVSCTDSGSVSAVFVVTVNTPTISVENKTGLKIGESYTPSPTLTNPSSTSSSWTVTYSKTTNNNATTISGSTITGDTYNTTGDTYTAYFKYNNVTKASTTFTVKTDDPTISFNSTTQTLNVGGTVTKTATGGNIGSGATGTISYSSSATAVATVDSSGKVTALTPGTTTITATYTVKIGTTVKATKTASYTVNVNTPTVTMSGKTVAKGDSVAFTATTTNPSSGLNIAYSLQSAVSGVSINSSTGVVSVTSGCTASSATVVATVTNAAGTTVATKTATLTIQAPSLTIADIANNSTRYATIGTNIANKTLTTNFTNASFTPTSSKTSVATVSVTNGKLTVVPVAKGKTTITVEATKGSISVSQTFTVKVAAAASTDVVVYLQDFTYNNNDGWGAAYIHTWETDGGAAISDRAQMTKIGVNSSGRSVYAYKFTAAQWAKVNHIVFLKTNADSAWDDQWSHTEDKFNGTHGTTTAFQLRSDSNGSARKLDTSTISISIPQISADDIADLPITTSTTLYADVVNNTTPSKFTWSSASTSIATVANADTGTTDHNSITGVYPGTTTITIKAYAALPTGWTSIVTDGTADAFLADSTTASVTVTATPKTVSWGNKLSTDNGSTFATTNASAAGTVSVSPTMTNGGSVAHGTQITFTATTNSGYKFAGWQVDGNNNFTTTTSKTITVTANTTVYALYYKTWTITVNKNTGINTYKTNHSSYTGTYSAASKTFTVNAGQSFNIKNITYTAGYESDTSTNLTNSDVQNNITVTINAKKTNYSVSGSLSPSGLPSGITIKFKKSTASSYSNSLSNANVGDTINIQVTTTTGYYLKTLTASAGTAPSIPSSGGNGTSYTMNYTMTASDVTFTATLAQEISVNFNIDMHESAVNSTKVLQLFISSSANNPTATTDHTGASCSIISSGSSPTLTKQSTSTVYSGNVNVPITGDTVYFVVRYDGTNYYKSLSKTQISGGTVWLETTSDSPTDLSIVYSTNNTPTVASGYQRIYLKKPYGWQDTTEGQKWTNIGVYYWGDNPTDIGWANDNSGDYRVTKMKYLGYDTDTSSGFHYYYADIPTTITQNSTPYTVKNIIFQGWGSNESLGGDSNKIHAQTENVMNFTKNYFTLNNSNNVITAEPAATNAKVPTYTRYASSVTVQKGETQTINIKPTSSNTITYSSSNTSVATVSSSGVVTPVAKGTATITVKVYGTVGYLVRSNEQTDKDRKSYTLTVTVKDPSVTSGFDIMSLATRTSTITIPMVSSTQPGYFDSAPSVAVTGTPNAPTAGYTNSAIVTATATQSVSGVGSKATTYTVKYAAPNSTFTGYSGITVTAAEIVSKSIRFEGSERYGYDHWEKGGSTQSYTVTKSVTDGVETAITNNIALDGSTFSEVFSSYTYVDVTFNFDYYEYKTERTVQKLDAEGNPIPIYDSYDNPTGEYETEQKNFYYYDPTWVGTEDRTSASFNASKHIPKTYTVTDFEVRNKTATAISASGYDKSNLVGDAGDAVYNMPTSNYYKYTLNASTIKTISKTNNYKATINVELKHNPKAYTVKLNGSAVNNSNSEYSSYHSADGTSNKYYYQEYAKLTNSTSLNWILTDSGQSYTGPTMYTGKSYKFRVTGDTYLKTSAGTVSDADFNRTRVALTGQEVKHEPKSATNSTIVEKLYNNFYIADFFDPAKVLNDRDLPEDDVKFVGGGVVYYQIKDGVPAQKAVDGGYVNSSTGLADADAIKEFIQEKIEANLTNTTIVPNDIEGDDDRMAIAYGYEHKAQKDADTDLFYRYLPYEVYNRTGGGTLETETVEGVTSYTLATERQSNAYRYSNALKAYQYIYASSMENKIANAGKNMCLYAYYIYSYTEYDNVTGIPRTVYKVVLSDQPANATSYFHNPNSNS